MGQTGGGSFCDSEEGNSEDASIRPDIIDGFERKSVALLDYVNNLEAQLEQQKVSFEHREGRLKADKKALEEDFAQREAKLKAERRVLEEKLHHTLDQLGRAQKAIAYEDRKWYAHDEAIHNLKLDVQAAQDLLQNERERSKGLEDQLVELKEHVRLREQAHNRRHLKDEREKAKLEEETATLKKKVTLGWILGCLSEVYLRVENESEPEKGVKVMGQLFKDDGKPVRLESIEKEVKRLISDPVANHNQKHPATSPRKVQGDFILESEGYLELDVYLDSSIIVGATHGISRPCRYVQSVMDLEHEYHHHLHGTHTVSPCPLED